MLESNQVGGLDYVVATSEMSQELAKLINSAYRGDSSKKGWTTEADILDGQRTDAQKICNLTQSPEKAILVRKNWAIDACVLLERKDSRTAYLGMLTVSPELQAKGTGRELLLRAEMFAKSKWNASNIEITVINLRQELISWYERRGYTLTGETRDFPMQDVDFGLPKRRDFHFVVMMKTL